LPFSLYIAAKKPGNWLYTQLSAALCSTGKRIALTKYFCEIGNYADNRDIVPEKFLFMGHSLKNKPC
jgi:hypothetical protein